MMLRRALLHLRYGPTCWVVVWLAVFAAEKSAWSDGSSLEYAVIVADRWQGRSLGGLLTDHLHWSLIFWINVPLGAVALVMTERALRRLPRHDRPHQLDMIGAFLMVGAAIALMLALAWGGTHYPWSSARIVTLFGASAALWVLLASRSSRFRSCTVA